VARAQAASLEADFHARSHAHALASRAYAGLGLADSAVIAGLAAVESLERVRTGLAAAELRTTYADASADVYGSVVLSLLGAGRTAEAFAVADGARSRELLQQLTTARSRASTAADTADFGAAELLLRRIDALLSQLNMMESIPPGERASGTEDTTHEIVRRVTRLRDEYESLQLRMAGRDPRSAQLLGAVRADHAAVQAAIAADEAMLHFTLVSGRVVVFVARSDRFETLQLELDLEDLASRVRLLRDMWGSPGAALERGLPVARGLHRLLIAPIRDAGLLTGASRLVVVPHGILEQLPFATLHDEATGRFLVQDYVIAYAPSANAFAALRAPRQHQSAGARRVNAFAPLIAELPATRAEAVAANRAGSGGSPRLGRNATERAVRRALHQPAAVHIATHGVLNSRNPMFSRVDLARGGGGSSMDDGRLEVHEVLRMQVRSPLVVLSGCETAAGEDWSGDPLRGSGLATLAQAFLQAGARNVVATLWRIDDEGSAELVSRFYREGGMHDGAHALAAAQRALIREGTWAAPYYWAGYVLMGDGLARRSL
jgi:CHAT domain-containing protein